VTLASQRGCDADHSNRIREVGADDVASFHHRNVLLVNGLPDIRRIISRLDILIERWETAQTSGPAKIGCVMTKSDQFEQSNGHENPTGD